MRGRASIVAALALIGLGLVAVWAIDPLATANAIEPPLAARSVSAAQAPAVQPAPRLVDLRLTEPTRTPLPDSPPTLLPQAARAGVSANPDAPAMASLPDRAVVAVRPTPTPAPNLLRNWETSAGGVISDPALVARLDELLANVDGHVSIVVKDLASDRGAVLEAEREQPAASLYKLPVMYSTFAAGLGLGEALPITEETRAYDLGTLELGVGEILTVAEALERMITLSDNTSGVMLASRVGGGGRINASVSRLGMDMTHYGLVQMTTSALDMLHLLDLIAHGEAVSPAASAEMVHLLLRQRVNDRLPRLLPGDVQVAHKTGNLPGTVNDVGILYGPTTTVAVAALISDTSDEAGAASAIARVALAAYSYFDEQPEDPNRPTIPPKPDRRIPPVWRQPRPTPTPTPEPTAEQGSEPDSEPNAESAQPVGPAPSTSGRGLIKG